ncbi:probable serine/threonine-protein kinase PBL3 [Chenopodium quinoa]|uniref:probable serine/threonine-protein kinase PBL3 n=1 Tax=Chenopodium quinoa TaxID=63459 RepID=UPI000B798817|nr:probable serine/threonine-protein kinase PBL3 [Chenopodium quinoa]
MFLNISDLLFLYICRILMQSYQHMCQRTQVIDIQSYATQGYAAPEFVNTGSISAKSDVYSYGILLLVLLTRRPALKSTLMGEEAVVDWIKAFREKLLQMMDPRLKGQYPKKAAFTVATLALQCTLVQASSRPEMSDVLQKLKKAVRPSKCI